MKTHTHRLLFIALLLGLLFTFHNIAAASEAAEEPFSPGEKLTFRLSWEFIPAGEATLEVKEPKMLDGQPVMHFALTARSNAFIDAIYKVRDHIEAFADAGLNRSVLYRKRQKEGSHHREIEVRFDWADGTARYTNKGKAKDPIDIMPGTFDPLSAFYCARRVPLKENLTIELPITDGKKVIMGSIKVLRRETITIDDKTYDTFVVEPDLKDVGGVFRKSPDASMFLWLTADHRRIPVRIESEVAVGSFIGELVSVSHPAETRISLRDAP